MEPKILLFYLVTWTFFALTPGPAVMYSMATATRYGFRASFAGICGIQAGNLVLFASVAAGLGALLAASNNAFVVLRIIGAAYLFWLGLRLIRQSFKRPAELPVEASELLDTKSAVRGLLIQVTNPKALLFVTALLPPFIDPARSATLQLTILVFVTILVDTIVLSGYALAAERGASRFRRSRVWLCLERIFGAALIFFSARLLAARK